MKAKLVCQYCNHQWQETVYGMPKEGTKRCSVCNDRNVKIKKEEHNYVDYYEGSPPFSSKEEDIEAFEPRYNEPIYYDGGD